MKACTFRRIAAVVLSFTSTFSSGQTPADEGAKDLLYMSNGTVVRCNILSEGVEFIDVEVVVGTLRAPTTYSRKEISRICKGCATRDQREQASEVKQPPSSPSKDHTAVLARATADARRKEGGDAKQWTASVRVRLYVKCDEDINALYMPDKVLSSGAAGSFEFEAPVAIDGKYILNDAGKVASLLATKLLNEGPGIEQHVPRLYAYMNGRLMEGTATITPPAKKTPNLGPLSRGEVERAYTIEWAAAPSSVGTNRLLATVFGPRMRRLIVQLQTSMARSEEEAAEAQNIRKNGVPISCNRCGGDGQLAINDGVALTPEELAEYERNVQRSMNQGDGFARIRVRVRCQQCAGAGTRGVYFPSPQLEVLLKRHEELHTQLLRSLTASLDDTRATLDRWAKDPAGEPNFEAGKAKLEAAAKENEKLSVAATESREVFERIKVLLREELSR